MKDSPFQFGKIVTGSEFVNRTAEVKRLSQNITGKINTILISPRRWGKTSLVYQTGKALKRNKYVFVYIDMFSIRSEEDFFRSFAREIIRATADKWDDVFINARNFLSRLVPQISLGADGTTDLTLDFSFDKPKIVEEDIFSLPQRIAEKKKIIPVICIDEFQNIEYFENPKSFQKRARSFWQKQQDVVYVLYGSKRHMLMQLFEKQSMPFYRFGDILYLDKIEPRHFIPFITEGFRSSSKQISPALAEKITETVKNHPYYVQQLAHITWTRTTRKVTSAILDDAIEELIQSNSIYYEKEFEGLSASQINLMKAIADGNQDGLTRAGLIRKYNLNSSANVIKALNALENKELIERFNKRTEFADPAFELWFKKTIV